jgi:flagellar motor protein MotB
VKYLTVTKGIPLRRVTLPMGYGATMGTNDNSTEEGRAKNRRVDVKVLVNKGASTPAPPARG